MEIAIAVFLGIWFSLAGLVAYLFVRHDFKDVLKKSSNQEKKTEEKKVDEL